jgi:hypothetical protein
MRVLFRIVVVLVLLVAVVGAVAYIDGSSLPVAHSVGVSGIVSAPPAKVFAIITDVGNGASWRPEIKGVKMLPPDDGRDHWVEDIGHGQTMTFLAVRTDPPVQREVLLQDPDASYGGAWLYELRPGPNPNETNLTITETGFIHPPLYRFIMAHVFGPTYNLRHYMNDIQAAAGRP